METIEIGESNYQDFLNLDIVAFSYANEGAMGEPGGICMIDKSGQEYHANYYWGKNTIHRDHIKDIFPVFTELKFGLLGAESNNENWELIYLGFGNSLFIRKDISDEFNKKVAEANFQSSGELYQRWFGIVLGLLGKGASQTFRP